MRRLGGDELNIDSYDSLINALRVRIAELGIRAESVDEVGGVCRAATRRKF